MYRNDDNINNNIPSFDDIRKGIDYSVLDDQLKEKKKKDLLIKKVAIGFASVVLVVGGTIGVVEISNYNVEKQSQFSLGTYYYEYHVGEIDGFIVSEECTLILSTETKEGPGTFVISEDDWNIYGEFSNSTLDSYTYQYKEKINESYYYDSEMGTIKFDYVNKLNEIIVEVISSDENIKIVFRK